MTKWREHQDAETVAYNQLAVKGRAGRQLLHPHMLLQREARVRLNVSAQDQGRGKSADFDGGDGIAARETPRVVLQLHHRKPFGEDVQPHRNQKT